MAKKKYYAVRNGRKIGIFSTWPECQAQISGFSGAQHKSFESLKEAEEYMNECNSKKESHNSEVDTINCYIGGLNDEQAMLSSYAVLCLANSKSMIQYEKFPYCVETAENLAEVKAAIKAMEVANQLKDNFNRVVIYYQSEEIEKLCNEEKQVNSKLYNVLLDTYRNLAKSLPVEFKRNISKEELSKVNTIAQCAINEDIFSIVKNISYHECNTHNLENLVNVRGLNVSPKEYIEKIADICRILCIEMSIKEGTDVNTDKHIIIYFNKNYLSSEIHLYNTKEGLSVNLRSGKFLELNYLIIEEMNSKYTIGKVEEKSFCYSNLSEEKITEVISNLMLFNDDKINYEVFSNEPKSHMKYSITIKSKVSNEKVYVYIYTNNKLEIRGIKYLLWEDVCYVVEKSIGVTLNDIIGRVNVGIDLKYNVDILDSCDENLKKELGDELVDFLYTYDYDVIVSVNCSFNAMVKISDYGIYIDPLTKAFEGYFKKMLLHLKIVPTAKEINKPTWNFKSVFNTDYKLNNDLHSCLNSDNIKREKQLDILSQMCNLMWTLRNKINHSGPKGTATYNNYEQGLLKYQQIIELIKESFAILY